MRRTAVAVAALLVVWCGISPAWAQEQEVGEPSRWGLSASGMVGKFKTDPLESVVDEATGYLVDFTGRSFDIGVARGRPGHSYFRIAFVQLTVDDGSSTENGSALSFTRDVKVQGVKVERVWRLGPDHWPVAPMLSLHGGIGKLSGQVEEHNRRFTFDPVTGEFGEEFDPPIIKDVADSLEYSFFPVFGVSAGVTASIVNRFTITASVAGIEFPGVYYGQIQGVFWF